MSFINHTTNWVKGEINQGKIMAIIGILCLISVIYIWKYGTGMLSGMLIPTIVTTLIMLGYGFHLIINRPNDLKKITINYQQEAETEKESQVKKAEKEFKNFNIVRIVWTILAITGMISMFYLSHAYQRGIIMGIIIFSVFAFCADTFLYHRLKTYHENIVTE